MLYLEFSLVAFWEILLFLCSIPNDAKRSWSFYLLFASMTVRYFFTC